MARRSQDWNVGLAEDLRDPAFARDFLLAAMEEDVAIQVALGKVIRAMGVKEFAAKVDMAARSSFGSCWRQPNAPNDAGWPRAVALLNRHMPQPAVPR